MSTTHANESAEPSHFRVSDHVLSIIATKEGTSPLEFDQLLTSVIDPDALDALFQDGELNGCVEFTYLGYRVNVSGDGQVSVSERDSRE